MAGQHVRTRLRLVCGPKHPQYHHVTIDGTGTMCLKWYLTPSQYEHAVLSQLHRIYRSHTGQAVFHEFAKRSRHAMKIIPYESRELNAWARPIDLRQATKKGEYEHDGRGDELRDDHGRPLVGQGGGTETIVAFTPARFTEYCNENSKGHKSGAQPDEILFHEMIHATRQMRGVFNARPLGFGYDTEEEFFAILLANIYASETARPIDLRLNHHAFDPLIADADVKFLPQRNDHDYRYRLVGKLVREEPMMAQALSRVYAPFNPIRRYYELQRTSIPPLPVLPA